MTRSAAQRVEIPVYRKRGTRETLTFAQELGDHEVAVISAPASVILDPLADVVTLIVDPGAEDHQVDPSFEADRTNALEVHPANLLRYAGKGWYGLSLISSDEQD
jgi:hypothetical protein